MAKIACKNHPLCPEKQPKKFKISIHASKNPLRNKKPSYPEMILQDLSPPKMILPLHNKQLCLSSAQNKLIEDGHWCKSHKKTKLDDEGEFGVYPFVETPLVFNFGTDYGDELFRHVESEMEFERADKLESYGGWKITAKDEPFSSQENLIEDFANDHVL